MLDFQDQNVMLWLNQVMVDGGPVMWFILGCLFISVFIALDRVFHFHRAQLDVEEFLHGLFNVLKRNNVVEAIAICDETPGPVAHVLRAAILRCDQNEGTLRQAADEATLSEVPRLEKNMKALATIALISPLFGLLGTVCGMIGAFEAMQDGGPFVGTVVLAKHVKEALLTTAFGLTVAIPSYAFYNFLVARVESLVLDMERAASEMIYFLTHNELTLDDVYAASDTGTGAEE